MQGYPQSVELPERCWGSIIMDSNLHFHNLFSGNNLVTLEVDRLTKRVRANPTSVSETVMDVVQCFLQNIFKVHGLPDSIDSFEDLDFTSEY